MGKLAQQWKGMGLHWKIIIGLIFGVGWAFLSSYFKWSEFTLDWIDPWGKIFINLLKLIAVPLVLFSIIKGISGLSDATSLGKVGIKTLVAYLITTVTAVGIGLVLVNVIQPGNIANDEDDKVQLIKNRLSYEMWVLETPGAKIMDDKNYLSDPAYAKYLDAAQKEYATSKEEAMENQDLKLDEKLQAASNRKSNRPLNFIVEMVPENIFFSLSDNKLMLKTIFFAIFFGLVLIMIPRETAKPVIGLVDGMNEIFLKMVDIIMKGAPFFVFALLAGTISKLAGDDPKAVVTIFESLGWYSLVVIIGLGCGLKLFVQF